MRFTRPPIYRYPRDSAKFKLILPRCVMHERGIVFLNINLAPRPFRASSTVSRSQNYARAIQRRADRLVSNAVRDSWRCFLSLTPRALSLFPKLYSTTDKIPYQTTIPFLPYRFQYQYLQTKLLLVERTKLWACMLVRYKFHLPLVWNTLFSRLCSWKEMNGGLLMSTLYSEISWWFVMSMTKELTILTLFMIEIHLHTFLSSQFIVR